MKPKLFSFIYVFPRPGIRYHHYYFWAGKTNCICVFCKRVFLWCEYGRYSWYFSHFQTVFLYFVKVYVSHVSEYGRYGWWLIVLSGLHHLLLLLLSLAASLSPVSCWGPKPYLVAPHRCSSDFTLRVSRIFVKYVCINSSDLLFGLPQRCCCHFVTIRESWLLESHWLP